MIYTFVLPIQLSINSLNRYNLSFKSISQATNILNRSEKYYRISDTQYLFQNENRP